MEVGAWSTYMCTSYYLHRVQLYNLHPLLIILALFQATLDFLKCRKFSVFIAVFWYRMRRFLN